MDNIISDPQNKFLFDMPGAPAIKPSPIEEKVVKSFFGSPFSNGRVLDVLIEEEKALGWSLVEVIDGASVRFSRPVSERGYDLKRYNNGCDPYRTTYGITVKSLVQITFFLMVLASNFTYHLFLFP